MTTIWLLYCLLDQQEEVSGRAENDLHVKHFCERRTVITTGWVSLAPLPGRWRP